MRLCLGVAKSDRYAPLRGGLVGTPPAIAEAYRVPLMLKDKRILLVIGGGIAAYKALDLIRRLKERGASVRCVLTKGGQEFVTPLAVGALCGERAFTELFDLKNDCGLSDLLKARTPLSRDPVDVMVQHTQVPGLYALTSGTVEAGASNLLYSPRLAELLLKMRGVFDTVLIDTPARRATLVIVAFRSLIRATALYAWIDMTSLSY